MEGYEFIYINRRNKQGGDVAMFIDINYSYKVIEKLSTVVDYVLECLSIEIAREKKKNIIVSCIYRTPGSNINTFKNWMEEHFVNLSQKVLFVGGDFNIDLLNPNKHRMTDEVINTLFSLGLYPQITKPSRITTYRATLIDNIFSNEINNKIVGGLMLNDISDHLPVFTVYSNDFTNNNHQKIEYFKRVKTEETLDALKTELLKQDWSTIYEEKDTNKAYDEFLKIFKRLYNENCPNKIYNKNNKHKENQWMHKGLENACKKKNTLYKIFIKTRTKEAEN